MNRYIFGLSVVVLLTAAPVTGSESSVEHINTGQVLPPGLPFSEAVQVGNMLYLSGQIGIRPKSLELVEGGIEAESHQTLKNIQNVLEARGLGMSDIVKCTVMLADIEEWPAFNEVYATYFTAPYPARSAFAASGLAMGARVELECMAAVP
jgi:reactive intermediate/imine deaminase